MMQSLLALIARVPRTATADTSDRARISRRAFASKARLIHLHSSLISQSSSHGHTLYMDDTSSINTSYKSRAPRIQDPIAKLLLQISTLRHIGIGGLATNGAAQSALAMPEDALYEILLRLPAKNLCRLRVVCRSWRSLLSDPHFIMVHAACHPEPLFVVGYRALPGRVLCDIVDLSGCIVKRVLAGLEHEWAMYAQLDFLCVAIDSTMTSQLLDLATGAVHPLPDVFATEHAVYGLGILDYWASTAFGLVASTGEYKVLRVLEATPDHHEHPRQLYEVFTLDHGNRQACWRAKKAPPYEYNVQLGYSNSVVINGAVYFLLSDNGGYHSAYRAGLVASFDLEMEEWGACIQGPLSNLADDDVDVSTRYMRCWTYFSMAVLNDSAVLGCRTLPSLVASPSLDLWFLMDCEKGLWVKQHSIQIGNLDCHVTVQPLLVLNDGRIVCDHIGNVGNWSFLKIYDPGSKTYTDVIKTGRHAAVGLYGGNLLSLPNRY